MPFPATRHSQPYVGATRGQGPRDCPRTNPSLHGVLWGYMPPQRSIGQQSYAKVQCCHLCRVLTPHYPTPTTEQAHGPDPGQCPVPSRQNPQALASQASKIAYAVVSPAVQPGTQSDREGLETGTSPCYPQSILLNTGRSRRCRQGTTCSMGTPQFPVASLMRHHLRRCV
jgi:hypothetical protein